jgi:Meiotically Up-regulated Gene 113 (MUG113) protein
VNNRLKQFGVKLPFKWELVTTKASSNYSKLEADLHRHFASKRLEGEWFDLSEADLQEIETWA